jgi:hypothetical protein
MTNTARVWQMHGHAADNGVWVAVGEEWWVRIHGYGPPPVPVTVAEDPEGDYMGWIATGEDPPEPGLIQHHRIFNIQFPDGYQAEVTHGRGEAVRLSITVRETPSETDHPEKGTPA